MADGRRTYHALTWGVQALGELGPYSWDARHVLIRLLDGQRERGYFTACIEKAIVGIVRTMPADAPAGPAGDGPLPVLCALEPGVRDKMLMSFVIFCGVVEICTDADRPPSLETLRVRLMERKLVDEISAATIRNHVTKVQELLNRRFGFGKVFERVQGRPFRLLPPAQKAHQFIAEYLRWEQSHPRR